LNSHPEVVGLSFDDGGIKPNRIQYAPGTDIEVQQQIIAACDSYDWSYLPDPDPAGFKKALEEDTNISDLLKFQIIPYLVLFDTYTSDPSSSKAQWMRVKSGLAITSE